MITKNIALTNADLLKYAPSVFGTPDENKTSDRYVHIPTIEVVDAFRDAGFYPVSAGQTRVKNSDNEMSTKHLLRFRSREHMRMLLKDEEIPEIALTNAHNGTAIYNLMFAIFRCICGNQCVVASGTIADIKVKHIGTDVRAEIIKASIQLIGDAPKVFNRIGEWKKTMLTQEEQLAYARSVVTAKGTTLDVNPYSVLQHRRYQESTDGSGHRDLWKTFNVVQENIVKGGSRGYTEGGKRQRMRGIKAVSENVRMNKAMWQLAEEMQRLKTA